MDRGDLVPDDVILGIMKETLGKGDFAKGSLLDGVVRTTPQADGMTRVLHELGRQVDAVLVFDIDDDELVQRLGSANRLRAVPDAVHGTRRGLEMRELRRNAHAPQGRRAGRGTKPARGVSPPDRTGARVVRAEPGRSIAKVNAIGSVDDVTRRALEALSAAGVNGAERR